MLQFGKLKLLLSSLWISPAVFAVSRGPLVDLSQNNILTRDESFGGVVSFDNYSLSLCGQRIFIQFVLLRWWRLVLIICVSSGEFHTYRLPVPSLWPDILQKIKASGLNTISIYTHWGAINPAPGVIDFDGYRALKPLYEAALEAGIWIILRPGTFPYHHCFLSTHLPQAP